MKWWLAYRVSKTWTTAIHKVVTIHTYSPDWERVISIRITITITIIIIIIINGQRTVNNAGWPYGMYVNYVKHSAGGRSS
jgi:hypothetical protein